MWHAWEWRENCGGVRGNYALLTIAGCILKLIRDYFFIKQLFTDQGLVFRYYDSLL
jgi:hypothetical protein